MAVANSDDGPIMRQVAYCEEQVECRRVILLAYFGEKGFSAARCNGTCDICKRNKGQRFEGVRHLLLPLLSTFPQPILRIFFPLKPLPVSSAFSMVCCCVASESRRRLHCADWCLMPCRARHDGDGSSDRCGGAGGGQACVHGPRH